ncbi:hypothetical protein, partial [Paraburkholderia sp. RL18-085-BIA-A]|uniref:hypothetical protein n=1 Tax=Paraburkholderia sp. RL18-085-BIA-A TaxID=3031633 RepID=UPI0038BBE0A3
MCRFQLADMLYQLTAPSHGCEVISRKDSTWNSVSIATMQLTVWYVCIPVNRKPVSSRGGQHPRRL